MESPIKLPENGRNLLLILIAIFLITRIPLLFYLPFVQDEALYAVMVAEQVEHPTSIPTFLGYPVSWKPVPFFWIHVPFYELPLQLEAKLRLPSLLAGLLSIPVLFRLFGNLGLSNNARFFTMLFFLFSLVTSYPHAALLLDSIMFLLISSSLLLYSERQLGQWRFIGAAALAFLAFFIKLVVAFMIPILAVAYFLTYDRKTLRNPLFVLSLLAVPAAMAFHYLAYDAAGLAHELYFSDVGGKLLSTAGLEGQLKTSLIAIGILIEGAGIWFALSLFGFLRYWKDNIFMSVWYVLSIFPMLSGAFMPWYFLPVAPAIAYFGLMLLLMWKGKERLDTLFWAFLSMALVLTLALTAFIYVFELNNRFLPQKEAGLLMAGKDNVVVMGIYNPGIISYKMLSEDEPKDFGWLLIPRNVSDDAFEDYIRDYHTDTYPLQQGSFSSMFTSVKTFRKDSNISDAEYYVLVGERNISVPDSELIYEKSEIKIYEVMR